MTADDATSPASRAKGPLVWLDMDQQALDDAYDQSVYAPNQEEIRKRRTVASNRAKEALGAPERVAYGPSEIEQLDLYPTSVPNAPTAIYIHGGAWRNGRSADFAMHAESFVNAGANYIVLDFTNIDAVGGDLRPMVDQVRRGVAWVYRNANRFGADPSALYVIGHSSGAHLSGCVLVTDWEQQFGLPRDVVQGFVLVSGMYDLKPVRLSKRSTYVAFTDEIEHAFSAQRHLDKVHAPVIVAYGTCETPEFQRQGRDFAAALEAAGKPVQLIVGEGYNHFEIQETISNPYGLVGRAALQQMGLGPG